MNKSEKSLSFADIVRIINCLWVVTIIELSSDTTGCNASERHSTDF